MLIQFDGPSERLLVWHFSQTAFERSTSGISYQHAENLRDGIRRGIADRRERIAQDRAAGLLPSRRRAADPWDPAPIDVAADEAHEASNRQEPSHDDLTRYAVATRWIEAMGRLPCGERHLAVIGAYHGAPGAHFAEPAGVGLRPGQLPAALPRVQSLMHLTPEGRKLLEKTARQAFEGPAYARMRVACLMRDRKAYADVQPLFIGAEQRAQLWFEQAWSAWHGIGASAAAADMERRLRGWERAG